MKRLLIMLLLLCGSGCLAQTRPHWLQIQETPVVDIRAFGAVSGAADVSAEVTAAAASLGEGGTLYIPAGTWKMSITIQNRINIIGDGYSSRIMSNVASTAAVTFENKPSWDYNLVSKVTFDGNSKLGHGLTWDGTPATSDGGRTELNCVAFENCDYGIRKVNALGVTVTSCEFSNNNIGIYDTGDAAQHAGCLIVEGSEFHSNELACIYIYDGYPNGSGQITITNCTFEVNVGHSIACFKFDGDIRAPLRIASCWFEELLTSEAGYREFKQITIDGHTATAATLILFDTTAKVEDCTTIESICASNSTAIFDNCGLPLGAANSFYFYPTDYDPLVNFTWHNRTGYTNNVLLYGNHDVNTGITHNIMKPGALLQANVARFMNAYQLPHRTRLTNGYADKTFVSFEFASTSVYLDTIGAPIATAGSILFDQGLNVIGSTTDELVYTEFVGTNATLTADVKYYAWTLDVKRNNVGSDLLHGRLGVFTKEGITYYAGATFSGLPSGQWVTLGNIFKKQPGSAEVQLYLGMSANAVLGDYDIGGFQVLGFDSFTEAQQYLNSGLFQRSVDGG